MSEAIISEDEVITSAVLEWRYVGAAKQAIRNARDKESSRDLRLDVRERLKGSAVRLPGYFGAAAQ